MVWKLNRSKFIENEELTEDVLSLVGDSLIEEIVVGRNCSYVDYLKMSNGAYICRSFNGVHSVGYVPNTSRWLIPFSNWKDYFIEVDNEDTDDVQSSEEYYTFLGDKYYTREELGKAIEDYSETEDGGVYYYHHHKVEEHILEITPYKKVSGEYDQSTLDKVNEILKSNGIDFVVKGDKQ